jgi:hypothetical protein
MWFVSLGHCTSHLFSPWIQFDLPVSLYHELLLHLGRSVASI